MKLIKIGGSGHGVIIPKLVLDTFEWNVGCELEFVANYNKTTKKFEITITKVEE